MKAALHFFLLLSILRSSHSRDSVKVTPSKSQYFEYEQISVNCDLGSGEWRVWRYSANGLMLSHCGSGWGSEAPSTCVVNTAKLTDTGVYWCESRQRESSNIFNITVTGGSVILESPVHPVEEGSNVTLLCKSKTSNLAADFYKDGLFIKNEPTGHMTINHVSTSDEGLYKCNSSSHGESPASWLLIKDTSVMASLNVSPYSSQMFEYEQLSLSCEGNSPGSTEWKIRRSLAPAYDRVSSCGADWGKATGSGCMIYLTKKPDSAVYWCESPTRLQRSLSANITVSEGLVILQSPAFPVEEGDNITLLCETKTSNHTANFYKDGSFISTEPTGQLNIYRVTTSDEGLYDCEIPGHGKSPGSWLFVKGSSIDEDGAHHISSLRIFCLIVICCPYCISTVLMVSLYRYKPIGRRAPVAMTTSPPLEGAEAVDPQYENITTEHHF